MRTQPNVRPHTLLLVPVCHSGSASPWPRPRRTAAAAGRWAWRPCRALWRTPGRSPVPDSSAESRAGSRRERIRWLCRGNLEETEGRSVYHSDPSCSISPLLSSVWCDEIPVKSHYRSWLLLINILSSHLRDNKSVFFLQASVVLPASTREDTQLLLVGNSASDSFVFTQKDRTVYEILTELNQMAEASLPTGHQAVVTCRLHWNQGEAQHNQWGAYVEGKKSVEMDGLVKT